MKYIKNLLYVLFVVSISYAQNDVIKNLQKKFESIQTLTADFTQVTRFSGNKNPVTNKGKLFYSKDDKYRIDFKNSSLVSDGESVWNYNSKANKVVISGMEEENGSFSIKNFIFDYPKNAEVEDLGKENGKENGKEYKLIRLKSKDEDSFKNIKIWFDQNDLVKKIEAVDKSGSIFSFELNNIKLDQTISSDKFTFNPPKGIEIIDLR